MEFKVELEGLETLTKRWESKRISKQLAQGIAQASNILTSEITRSVVQKYHVTSAEVNKTLLGKSVSLQKRGKNVVENGIVYKYRPKPLHEFPFKEFSVLVDSRFLLPRGKKVAMIKKHTAKGVKVSVIRGKSKVVTGNFGFGGFLQRKGSSKWAKIQGGRVKSFPTGIYERKQKATWIKEPELRAPIRRAFGPSITQMIKNRLDTDPRLSKVIDNFSTILSDNIDF